ENGDMAANNTGGNGGNANTGDKAANHGDKTNTGGTAANNNGGNGGKANNGGKADNNGSTVIDGAAGTDGKDAQGASPSDSKAGAGQKNSGIAKPGGNAQGGQGQAAAAAAATGDSRLPLTGASMTGIVLAVAAIALGGGFILVRRRMAG
ncbi:LPXTG cell wall anchor domain-containing protein, partial [Actinomyces sp.]|uniref:LPXTG cell wall anchor domain-containing protein n=1 Tax=Actinomyces sp. TaxID=29317 RepID=UPI0026DDA758